MESLLYWWDEDVYAIALALHGKSEQTLHRMLRPRRGRGRGVRCKVQR